jgi:hypothetical protein
VCHDCDPDRDSRGGVVLTVWDGVAFAAGAALWLVTARGQGRRLTWRTWLAGAAFGAALVGWTWLVYSG